MLASRVSQMPNDPILAVWTHLLSGAFSVLERMERLANCWDTSKRRYVQLAACLGADEAHAAIRMTHDLVWNDWLNGTTEAQETDLLLHLRSAKGVDRSTRSRAEAYSAFIPFWAREEDRRLFIATVSAALERLRNRPPDLLCAPVAISTDLHLNSSAYAIRDLIEREYADPDLSLHSLSKRAHLSERHLSRLFKSLTGKNIGDYLREVRIAKARVLLANSNHGIKFIAGATGYKYCSHFGRDFRRYMGCTVRGPNSKWQRQWI